MDTSIALSPLHDMDRLDRLVPTVNTVISSPPHINLVLLCGTDPLPVSEEPVGNLPHWSNSGT